MDTGGLASLEWSHDWLVLLMDIITNTSCFQAVGQVCLSCLPSQDKMEKGRSLLAMDKNKFSHRIEFCLECGQKIELAYTSTVSGP